MVFVTYGLRVSGQMALEIGLIGFVESHSCWYFLKTYLERLLTELLSIESMDKELMSKALATDKLFFMSLLLFEASFGEPCGVAAGVAAVWVIIGGFKGPLSGKVTASGSGMFTFSSFVTDTEGGRPNIFFSITTENIR